MVYLKGTGSKKLPFLQFAGMAFCLLLFLGLLFRVISHPGPFPIDILISNVVRSWRTPFLNQLMLFITYIGKSEIVIMGIFISCLIFALNKQYFNLKIILFSSICGDILSQLIKFIVGRPRPPHYLALVTENSPDFPSGHSFVVFYFYAVLAYLIFRQTRNGLIKFLTVLLTVLIITLVSFSRIYLGDHWLSDILGSWALGLSWISAVFFKIKSRPKPEIRKIIGWQIIPLWFIFLLSYFYINPLR